MLQILAVWGAFMPIQSMMTNLLVSRGKAKIFMWCTIVQGLLTLSMLLLLHPYGIKNMLVAYCVFNALWLMVWHYFANKEIRLTLQMFIDDTLPYLLMAAVIMIVTHLSTTFISSPYILLASRIGMAATLYIGFNYLVHSKELCEIINFLFKRKKCL
jgi:O-antigen/teichoic acid export membrane protein